MTAQERSTLDLVLAQLDRMEGKQDRIEERLRLVEQATAADTASGLMSRRLGSAALAVFALLLNVPAVVLLVSAHG